MSPSPKKLAPSMGLAREFSAHVLILIINYQYNLIFQDAFIEIFFFFFVNTSHGNVRSNLFAKRPAQQFSKNYKLNRWTFL